jgi:hypothetical protein
MRTLKMLATAGLLVGAGAIIGTVLTAEAANKTVTLIPPVDHSSPGLKSVCVFPNPDAGAFRAVVSACATDVGNSVPDCGEVALTIPGANAQAQGVCATALTAWKAAKGY